MTILRIRKSEYNTLMTSFLSYKINYFPLGFIYLLLLLLGAKATRNYYLHPEDISVCPSYSQNRRYPPGVGNNFS